MGYNFNKNDIIYKFLFIIYENPIILSLFQIVTWNFTLFIFIISTSFLKPMSLKNRFLNFTKIKSTNPRIVFLYSHPSRRLYSFVLMKNRRYQKISQFSNFVTFLDFIYWFPMLSEIRDKKFQLVSMLFQSC